MAITDPFAQGMQDGWNTLDASTLSDELTLEADVVIVGSGAGGATSAHALTERGLSVIIVEEGPLKTSQDFKLLEPEAYANLYQEGLGRMSKDQAIVIMQGRAVGGSTLINWTSSFRTPPQTLAHWASEHQVRGHSAEELAPWFEKIEQRLGIKPWHLAPNANNQVIQQGCQTLGYSWALIPRNVDGCWNLGYCGLGCPTNAKQSMLVTSLPAALNRGATLIYRARAERLHLHQDHVQSLECVSLNSQGTRPTGTRIRLTARHYVLAGGGINTPALLLRSRAPDPYEVCGKRTFLHVVNFSAAHFATPINPFYGAPQSVYSDHFQWQQGVAGPIGYKLEVPPLQPALASSLLGGFGLPSARAMQQLSHTNVMLALMRDGFHPDSAQGQVELRQDGSPVLDYSMTPYTWDGIRRAFHSMAEIQFAAGATEVAPVHVDAGFCQTLSQAKALIDSLKLEPYRTRLSSAHVMGGCAMGEDARRAVTDSLGRHHQLKNLSIHDGSLFPTSIGANPQLSVYALSAKLSEALGEHLQRV